MARFAGKDETRTPVPALVPLSARKIGFRYRRHECRHKETAPLELTLHQKTHDGGGDVWEELDTTTVVLRVRQPAQCTRTFRSAIDGSVQYFAVVPALPTTAETSAASRAWCSPCTVQVLKQSARPSRTPPSRVCTSSHLPIAVRTASTGKTGAGSMRSRCSSRPSGLSRLTRSRTYLTGHSMGGHGTWHLGVTYPDRFAAIAPSAGWISMWSYAGARRAESPRADGATRSSGPSAPSDTLALSRNLAQLGVYVLHGDADDNVPVDQARQMRQVLGEFHPDFAYHEQPGAGHWWGNVCVDWPPLFAFLERRTIPPPAEVRRVDFTTASPGVSHRAHWASIEAQLKSMVPSTVHIELDGKHRRFHGKTENVARLGLDVGHALPGRQSRSARSWSSLTVNR